MFTELFVRLRAHQVGVTLHEWLTLIEALERGLIAPNLTSFYYGARAILVKREADFDRFDEVFLELYRGIETGEEVLEGVLDWLDDPKRLRYLSEEEMAALEGLDLDRLRELFEQRLKEQTDRHDGGNRWIGTGGTSPFGHGGFHPTGVRVGGMGRGRQAVQIASKRQFQGYRNDIVLDTRQIQVALRRLRRLVRQGRQDELDVDESIDRTCRNAGDLELVFRAPRRNPIRMVLLMDAGGSMTPHARLVSRLFSAASKGGQWKSFQSYYFHNCVYENVWSDISMQESTAFSTTQLISEATPQSVLVMVGDAAMHPGELTERFGSIDYWHRNETPGVEWLQRLRKAYPVNAWVNPMPERWWNASSLYLIRRLFLMFPLTLLGLDDAVTHLRSQPS